MSGAAVIITTIPHRRAAVNALANECLALANDVNAEVLEVDLDKIAFALQQSDWLSVDQQIEALGVTRPYVQQS